METRMQLFREVYEATDRTWWYNNLWCTTMEKYVNKSKSERRNTLGGLEITIQHQNRKYIGAEPQKIFILVISLVK